jgi:hypothetical protein
MLAPLPMRASWRLALAVCGCQLTVPGRLPAQTQLSEKAPVATASVGRPAAFLGLCVDPLSAALQAHLPEPVKRAGVVVKAVSVGSPAEAAGLAEHDVLLTVNEVEIVTPERFIAAIEALAPKATARLTVVRHGKVRTVSVVMGVAPEKSPEATAEEGKALQRQRIMAILQKLEGDEVATAATYRALFEDEPMPRPMVPGESLTKRCPEGVIRLYHEQKECHVEITDAAGEVIFRGACGSLAQREKIPAAARQRLEIFEREIATVAPEVIPAAK